MVAPVLALLLMAQASPAAAVPPVPGAATTPVAAAPGEDLHFADAADRMTVPVVVADRGPFAFIVDTGAERTVVSNDLATGLALPVGPRVSVLSVTGVAPAATVRVSRMTVGSVNRRDMIAPVFNRGDLGALGILGLDMLGDRTVSIDFERQVMNVILSRRRHPAEDHASDEIIVTARSLFGQLVVTDASYHGRRVRVVLDTGSMVSIGNLAFQRLVGAGGTAIGPVSMISVTGNQLTGEGRLIGRINIGGLGLDGLAVVFAEAAPFARFGLSERPALMLGMDALRQFRRVDIDFANRQVRFRLPGSS